MAQGASEREARRAALTEHVRITCTRDQTENLRQESARVGGCAHLTDMETEFKIAGAFPWVLR